MLALVSGAAILLGMFELLRRGKVREKYTVLWLLVGVAVAVFGVSPDLLDDIAAPLHIADPPNLLLFAADVVLLLVTVHLSWEASRMEERTRALAEEVALLRERVEQS
ncbi:MAG: DUF2304 domain-containing protein [Amnibacterium sp.]